MCKLKNADKIVNVFNLRAQKASATATAVAASRRTATPTAQATVASVAAKGSREQWAKIYKQKVKIETGKPNRK